MTIANSFRLQQLEEFTGGAPWPKTTVLRNAATPLTKLGKRVNYS